ncbi:MAG TPA: RecQ family ATP-dependent DNA helicase [Chloroflexota bacterium]
MLHTPPGPDQLLSVPFGLASFRPGQREVIDALINVGAALAVFPTGAGKSLCYQLPALMFEGVTVVVSPLIALMKDQIDYLQRLGIAAERMDSSQSVQDARRVAQLLRTGGLRLLYVAPERFNNERFLNDLHAARVALFAVDEAHCISEWGHNFRPDYLKLAETARDIGAERVLALTATATPAVVDDICAGFGIPPACATVTGFHRPNLRLYLTPVTVRERDAVLLDRLRTRPPGPTIVYVTLQKTAEQVADRLVAAGFPARAYHAGLGADMRVDVQEWWMASNRSIVVATIAFGMGIDKSDVRYVYQYNLPKSLESYSQEIGRAGRDGLPSTVEVLACPADVPALENFAYGDTPTPGALSGLVTEVLGAGVAFDVSVTDLSTRHDMRPLVVRTVLTYLELLGVLRQTTPLYAEYEARPLVPLDTILSSFSGEPRQFLTALFNAARKGRIWFHLDPAEIATILHADRERVLRALRHLEDKQLVELRASEPRLCFTRTDQAAPDAAALIASLAERFQRHEQQEIARLQQVLSLAEHPGCQTQFLVGYFGEQLPAPCGHCGFCETHSASALPPPPVIASFDDLVDPDAVASVCHAHPEALADPRQQARFLCGLSSPALTRTRLSRHPLFGSLEGQPFARVLEWCASRVLVGD